MFQIKIFMTPCNFAEHFICITDSKILRGCFFVVVVAETPINKKKISEIVKQNGSGFDVLMML